MTKVFNKKKYIKKKIREHYKKNVIHKKLCRNCLLKFINKYSKVHKEHFCSIKCQEEKIDKLAAQILAWHKR